MAHARSSSENYANSLAHRRFGIGAKATSAFTTGLLCVIGALLLGLFSARSVIAGGVTVITHGFNSNVTDWVIPMAEKVEEYPGIPGTTDSCYKISITRNGSGQYVATATFLDGTPPLLTDSGEIVVKLDWSTLSSDGTSTTTIAQTAVSALLSTNLIPEMGGRPLAESPLASDRSQSRRFGHHRNGPTTRRPGNLG